MPSPASLALSVAAAFGGAVLAPLITYLGYSPQFPLTLLGMAAAALIPAALCRSFTTAATSSIAGVLAGIIFWLTALYRPLADSIVYAMAGAVMMDPVMAYILLLVAMSPLSGLLGTAFAPREAAVIQASMEGEAIQGGEVTQAAVSPQAEAQTYSEEAVYVKCPHCGEPIPEEAVFCPNCGRKVGGAAT